MNDYPSRSVLVIYVDVDDTFVRSYGTKRIPIPAAISYIRQLKSQGAEMYCWSSGGASYAKECAQEFGIDHCFTAFLPKPQVLVDDQSVDRWRYLLQIAPGQNHDVEELRHRLTQSSS